MKVSWTIFAGLMTLAGLTFSAGAENPPADNFGQPGFLVIEGAADSSSVFDRTTGTQPGEQALVWDQGRLVQPDSLPLENRGPSDLGVSFTADLVGAGASGRLILRDGIFPITEPITLTDGQMKLEVSNGELEVRGARITYRRQTSAREDFKSGLLLLAGMTLLVIVLLRRARLKATERTGN